MILGQRIRLDPNNVQRTFFERCAGTARRAFNWGLDRWQKQYAAGEKPNWRKLNAKLNAIKTVEFPWMTELPWKITNQALADLGAAFTNFFRRVKAKAKKPGYPHFKKKSRCQEGFAIEGRALRFEGRRVKIPKLGWVRTRQELRFPGKILSARFSKRADHWYISIQVEVADSWSYPHRCETQATVGIDLGVRDLAVLSTGEKVEAPRILRKMEACLRRLNKELSRRKKGGANWTRTRKKLMKLHEKVANIRHAVTHELTFRLVRQFRWIGIEDLNVAGMQKNHYIAKSVSDAAMSEVLRQIGYKALLAGSEIVKAGRWYPSTKTCHVCGVVGDKRPLNIRIWTCGNCGTVHDRDVNAAKNLETIARTAAQAGIAQRLESSGRKPSPAKLSFGWESSHCVNFG